METFDDNLLHLTANHDLRLLRQDPPQLCSQLAMIAVYPSNDGNHLAATVLVIDINRKILAHACSCHEIRKL